MTPFGITSRSKAQPKIPMPNLEHHPDLKVGGVTVRERADRAKRLLNIYAREVGSEDFLSALGDLVGDTHHLLHATGTSPSALESVFDAAAANAASESDVENHEGATAPPPFVVNRNVSPNFDRHFIVAGRHLGDDEDTVCHVVVPSGDARNCWQFFVEEILFDGTFPPNWQTAPGEPIVVHVADFEIPGPPINA